MAVQYRRAGVSDIAELTRLRMEFLFEIGGDVSDVPDVRLREELLNYFQDNIPDEKFIAWVAEDEGSIVATSGLCFYTVPPSHRNFSGKTAYIMNMYTHPSFRRRGIASELFSRIMKEASSRGYRRVVLHATDAGKQLYSKFGFAEGNNEMVVTHT